jgi:hypothetical protein
MAITRSLATVLALGLSFHIQHVASQFPPQPKGITVLKSKFHENVTISFKEVYFRVLFLCKGLDMH